MPTNEPRRVRWRAVVIVIALILGGAAIFVFGGYDDSPGAQLLGFVIVALGTYRLVRGGTRKARDKNN